MKLLVIDIETSPNIADVWGLWDQNVAINQIRIPSEVMCFAAKWVGKREVFFHSTFHDGKDEMLRQAYSLLAETDVAIHYNGRRFDVPHLNREFLQMGLTPPAPFKQIDLLETAKRQFNFPSNKLDYVSQALGIGSKVKHEGHELWVQCMAGDEKAWGRMKKYNCQDVKLTERLYDKLLPWIPNHPSYGALTGTDVCPNCGSSDLKKWGFTPTTQGTFQRFLCNACGKWSRSTHREGGTKVVPISP